MFHNIAVLLYFWLNKNHPLWAFKAYIYNIDVSTPSYWILFHIQKNNKSHSRLFFLSALQKL